MIVTTPRLLLLIVRLWFGKTKLGARGLDEVRRSADALLTAGIKVCPRATRARYHRLRPHFCPSFSWRFDLSDSPLPRLPSQRQR